MTVPSPTAQEDWPTRWYDCFDTLVTRASVEPIDVFRLLAWRLAKEGAIRETDALRFVRARVSTEAALRAERARSEVTLCAIYGRLRHEFGWTRRRAVRAARLEIDAEARLLIPVRGLFEEAFAQAGPTPVILTDTYLSGRIVTRLLIGLCGPGMSRPRVFASSDLQRTKASGELFGHVLDRAGLEPGQVVHRGDHPTSDVLVPRSLGMRVEPVQPIGLLPYEYKREKSALGDTFARVVGGAMRAARAAAGPSADPGALEAFGGHGATALAGYVAWLLVEARRRGIGRLWFLARDGQVLLEIARRMAPVLHPTARLDYVHASRVAWCLPAYPDLQVALDRWLARYVGGARADDVAMATGLPRDDALALMHLAASGADARDERHGALRMRFADRAGQARVVLLGYLRSRGLMEPGDVLLVDVGWNASLQRALQELLAADGASAPTIRGVYVGLRRHPAGVHPDDLLEYAPGEARINASVVELLTRADHGSTLGYVEGQDGVVAPVLQPMDPERSAEIRAAQTMILDNVDGLMRWMEAPGFPLEDFVPWLAAHGRARLTALCRTPSNAVGRALAAQRHDDGPAHARVASLALRHDRPALWRALLAETFGARPSWWVEGTIAASTRGRRDFMAHLLAQRAMLRVARTLRRGAGS